MLDKVYFKLKTVNTDLISKYNAYLDATSSTGFFGNKTYHGMYVDFKTFPVDTLTPDIYVYS